MYILRALFFPLTPAALLSLNHTPLADPVHDSFQVLVQEAQARVIGGTSREERGMRTLWWLFYVPLRVA